MSNVLPERWKFACKAEWDSKRIALSVATPLENAKATPVAASSCLLASWLWRMRLLLCAIWTNANTLIFVFCMPNRRINWQRTHTPYCAWVCVCEYYLCSALEIYLHRTTNLSSARTQRAQKQSGKAKKKYVEENKIAAPAVNPTRMFEAQACKGQRIAFALNRSPFPDCLSLLLPLHKNTHTQADAHRQTFAIWQLNCLRPVESDWRWARDASAK